MKRETPRRLLAASSWRTRSRAGSRTDVADAARRLRWTAQRMRRSVAMDCHNKKSKRKFKWSVTGASDKADNNLARTRCCTLLAVQRGYTGHSESRLCRAFATLTPTANAKVAVLAAGLTFVELSAAAVLMKIGAAITPLITAAVAVALAHAALVGIASTCRTFVIDLARLAALLRVRCVADAADLSILRTPVGALS
jgi:hypothetical protein